MKVRTDIAELLRTGVPSFRLHHGREPIGNATVGCEVPGCVAGQCIEDQPIRDANRRADKAFEAIFGSPA